ncbi:MAG: pyrroloquinoline quinone precursor peptide PqqA [Proteobacteria bacterium]|nr:pyrroloquinoline quinone precursor peptide PqqA [Pseudomonadota bacterium]
MNLLSVFIVEVHMNWKKPAYKELRFGFEVRMYISTK